MQNVFRVTISLPREDFKRIEDFRKKTGLQRSTIVDEAIRFWLSHLNEKGLVKKYVEGYKRKPDSVKEIHAFEKEAAEVFGEEGVA